MDAERWKKVEQLYHSALDREGSQRSAFLQEACAGDDDLQREVESLLAHEATANSFMESPAKGIAGNREGTLVGRQLGSYHVLSLLGVGGMGEVYRAKDLKLGREVALKVLPDRFARDPERLARFRREARVLASLNHPNIAMLHGLEESAGTNYLVMELVPGPTLAESVAAGPLPAPEALRISEQIAEAVEAAHAKGVVHRDLKPANVKRTLEGRVKVLDFGLAKAFAGDSLTDPTNAPTVSAAGTEDGRILGTPAYMSPEQVRGKNVGKQADIWAFGCLLYELLTGRRTFQGETLSDTISAVLTREPDWNVLPAETPAKVVELLRRCLHKETARRSHDITGVRMEMQETLTSPSASAPVLAVAPHPRARWRWALIGGLASVMIAAVVTTALWRTTPAPSQPVMRLNMNVSPADQLTGYN